MGVIQGMLTSFGGGGGVDPNPKTLIYCCGMECGRGGDGSHWGNLATNASFDTGTVRSGSRSLRFNLTGTARNMSLAAAGITISTHVVRCYIRFATLPNADAYLIWTGSGGARSGVAFKQSDSKIYAATGNPQSVGASGVSVTTGTWYRLDIKFVVSGSGSTVDAQVNGSAVGQATSGTAAGGSDLIFGASANVTADIYFDDVALSATSGDYPIGAGHVYHFVATSDGSHSTGTAGNFKVGAAGSNITDATTNSYQYIDELPIDDATPDTNDYINAAADTGASANYVEHVIGPAPGISTPSLGPRGIDVLVAYHQASASSGNSTFKINDNGTENTVLAFSGAGSTATLYARKHYASAPSSSSAWTTASGNGNFNNLRHRFGYSSDGSPDQYFDALIVEAEFSE